MLIHSCGELISKYLYHILDDAGWDGDVAEGPRYMFDYGNLYRRKVVVPEAASLSFYPGQTIFVQLKNVLQELDLFWPEKAKPIEVQVIKVLLREALAWCERWGNNRER